MAAILPSGMRAVSTTISPETGAGGFILPNDHVDVILTERDREAEKATGAEVQISETILSNVRVLAIDQTRRGKNGQKVVVGKTATLELTPHQVETSRWRAISARCRWRCAASPTSARAGRRPRTTAIAAMASTSSVSA